MSDECGRASLLHCRQAEAAFWLQTSTVAWIDFNSKESLGGMFQRRRLFRGFSRVIMAPELLLNY